MTIAIRDLSAQLNYRVNNMLKTFVAIEYKKDFGHAYWGTPLVPISFAGSHAMNGVVSGNAFSTFSGSDLGPMTIDSAHDQHQLQRRRQHHRRPGTLAAQRVRMDAARQRHGQGPGLLLSGQGALARQRNLCFRRRIEQVFAPNTIDRDRFFVTHDQHVVGNNVDFSWDSRLFGMDNRLAAQFQVSGNWITFVEEGNPNDYPFDNVTVINPVQGVYGAQFPDIRNKLLDDVALAFEDRLKITPEVRADRRRSGGRLDAVEQRRQLRWLDSRRRAVQRDLEAGLLSRRLHLRTDP